jgi:hypothetical protein
MKPTFDCLRRGLDTEAAVGVDKVGGVEDTESTYVLRPNLVGPQDKPVFRA